MIAADFRRLLLEKWGRSYDIQFRRIQNRVSLLVMWKYLEQPSFPLSEADYLEHLQGILAHLDAWHVTEAVCIAILETPHKPRLGKAVAIPLQLGERASEWLL